MVESALPRRRPSPRRAVLVGAVVAASLIVLTGCSERSEGATGGCAAPVPAPAAQTALMPSGLSLAKVGTVTHVRRSGGNIMVEAVATRPLDELTVQIQDAVTAAGYRPSGMDNEGDEAEVFFTSGLLAAGQARIERAEGCEGRWNIDLTLLEPTGGTSTTAGKPTTAGPTTASIPPTT